MESIDLILMFYLLYLLYMYVYSVNVHQKRSRRWSVRPINLSRNVIGYFNTTFSSIKLYDAEQFFKHTRMSHDLYDLLLSLLKTSLTKKKCCLLPIDFECRLAVTLLYLSQGVSQQYLAWAFHMAKSTIRQIILETCSIIWKTLFPLYVCNPNESDYKQIADKFWERWNMPNCVGAIDGKHIQIQCPSNSGSAYFNYKHTFSIVLLAACDADYCFTSVDVGAYGSQSDGGILAASEMGKALLQNNLPVPKNTPLPGGPPFPHYFVGDAAFLLRDNIMRPYPGRLLDEKKRIFNYRLSRARRVIENAFGILVARWRVLGNKINASPENCETIVLAAIALHNFIMLNNGTKTYCPPNFVDREDNNGNLIFGEWRNENNSQHLNSIRTGCNNASRRALSLRDTLANYFLKEGSVPFQYGRF